MPLSVKTRIKITFFKASLFERGFLFSGFYATNFRIEACWPSLWLSIFPILIDIPALFLPIAARSTKILCGSRLIIPGNISFLRDVLVAASSHSVGLGLR